MRELLNGAIVMACLVASLYFVRFWRASSDRLFAFFALAFAIMGINWVALAFVPAQHEARPALYVVRLVAFGLILVAIVDKNRKQV